MAGNAVVAAAAIARRTPHDAVRPEGFASIAFKGHHRGVARPRAPERSGPSRTREGRLRSTLRPACAAVRRGRRPPRPNASAGIPEPERSPHPSEREDERWNRVCGSRRRTGEPGGSSAGWRGGGIGSRGGGRRFPGAWFASAPERARSVSAPAGASVRSAGRRERGASSPADPGRERPPSLLCLRRFRPARGLRVLRVRRNREDRGPPHQGLCGHEGTSPRGRTFPQGPRDPDAPAAAVRERARAPIRAPAFGGRCLTRRRRIGRRLPGAVRRRSSRRTSDGAGEWIRTTDLLITNQLLCRLSYTGRRTPIIR